MVSLNISLQKSIISYFPRNDITGDPNTPHYTAGK